MKATKQLVNLLRTAAKDVRSGKREYCFTLTSRCVVGILAQILMNMNHEELNKYRFGELEEFCINTEGEIDVCGIWWMQSDIISFCERENIALPELFQKFHDVGVQTKEDFRFLEDSGLKFNSQNEVTEFFELSANQLEKELIEV